MDIPTVRETPVRNLLITGARIVDVRNGAVRKAAVRVRDGRIVEITGDTERARESERAGESGNPVEQPVPGDPEVLDAGGRYLVPGLVTVHTHLSIVFPFSDTDEDEDPALTAVRSTDRAWAALQAGATTIRCIHEQHRIDLTLREASRRGWVTLPRILAGGRALPAPGGHGQGSGSVYCRGPEQFRAAATAELEAGADHVKIFITGGLAHAGERPADPEMTQVEMAAVVRAAEQHGSYVVAHAGHHAAIRQALDAGVSSFEHAYEVDDATAALLARPGVYVSPTLVVTHSQATMRAKGFQEHSMANARRAAPGHLASIRRLVQAGVTLTHGTDYPPGDVIEGTSAIAAEAVLMQRAGLTPLQALQAATVNGARMCRIDSETGCVAEGLAADLLLLDDDPLRDIAALGRVAAVISGGTVVRNEQAGSSTGVRN